MSHLGLSSQQAFVLGTLAVLDLGVNHHSWQTEASLTKAACSGFWHAVSRYLSVCKNAQLACFVVMVPCVHVKDSLICMECILFPQFRYPRDAQL